MIALRMSGPERRAPVRPAINVFHTLGRMLFDSGPISLRFCLCGEYHDHLLDRLLEDWDIAGRRQPHLIQIDPKVVMDEFIAHPGNIPPRQVRILATQGLRKLFDGFANHLELPDNSVLV